MPERLKPYEWKPGQSGNPNGRPRMPEELKDRLRKINEAAVKRLEAMVESADTPPEVVRKIANDTADRLYGKPTQTIEADVTERRPIVVDSVFEEKDEADRETTAANPPS